MTLIKPDQNQIIDIPVEENFRLMGKGIMQWNHCSYCHNECPLGTENQETCY